MNIGFFTDTYYPQVNGVTFTLEAWRQKLQKQGHKVFIYYPGNKDYTPRDGEYPFSSIPLWFYKEYGVTLPIRVPKHTECLDIVHQHGLYGMAIAGLRASWANKTPRMLTFHTPGDEYISYLPGSRVLGGVYKAVYIAWERWLLNTYGHVTTASPIIKERLIANGVKDIEVLSNGLDLELFQRVDTQEFKERNGIGKEKVIGFCGRLGYEKHVEDLINAADGFDGTVLIAGGGPAEGYYRQLAEGKKNVKMLGFLKRNTLREFYSALDVFVFPSFCETQGLVALESMACGTPVVAVPVLALRTTIEEGVTGYHFTPGDTKGLLLKVEDCFRNMSTLRKGCLKEAARNSADKTVDRLEKIYLELTV
jgi:1,2-diacylglycerol 3-alpha-glucosyltransferase